jgi:hypothetical protein
MAGSSPGTVIDVATGDSAGYVSSKR